MKLIRTALLATAVVTGLKRYRQVQRATPELRVPLAYVPLLVNARTLSLMRSRSGQLSASTDSSAREVEVPSPAGPVRCFTYTPASGETRGALLWIHGGGRVLGSASQDHVTCQEIADDAGVFVLSVDYRLAPEHPFPAPLDDCHAALTWLVQRAEREGESLGPIAVGGASAGAGMAAELAQRAHDEGLRVDFQLLVYPMLDDRTLSHGEADRGHLVWTPASNRFGWSAYLGHPAGQNEQRPYAVAARRQDLAGLAPAWIGVGDLDLFHDEDVDYAERLRAAGVSVDLHIEKGMYHGANAVPGASTTPSMVAFHARMNAALRAAMATS